MRMLRVVAPAAMALALCGCSLSGLLGAGGKGPATLLTLTPEAQATGEFTRAAAAGQAVTVNPPVIGKELRTVRIPVQITPTDTLSADRPALQDALDLFVHTFVTVQRSSRYRSEAQ